MLIQPATAKLKREKQFLEANKYTAVIIALMLEHRAAVETAVVVIRIARNETSIGRH